MLQTYAREFSDGYSIEDAGEEESYDSESDNKKEMVSDSEAYIAFSRLLAAIDLSPQKL